MNKLTTLKNNSNIAVLDKDESQNVKGGIRYFTNNRQDFRRKKRRLRARGISFMTDEHNGVFCIEW